MKITSNLNQRCPREYEVANNGARRERCVKAAHSDDEPCQLNLWWALKVPPLGVGIGTSLDGGEITVRRVA